MFGSYSFQSIYTEFKRSFRLSLPLVAAQIVQSSSTFIATVMIAYLGKDSLAAGGLVWSIYITFVVFYGGMLNAVGVLVAQNHGANNPEGIHLAVSQGFILSLLLSIPTMIAFWFAPVLLRWSGQDHHIVILATQYLHSLNWSMLPLAIYITMEQFLIGLGRTRLVLWISILQIPCEIFTNYVFVFGKFGVHAFGVAGLGFGFSIVFTLAVIVIGLFICKSKITRVYKVFSDFGKINKVYLKELIQIGWPIGSMLVIEIGMFLVVAFMMGVFGTDTLAAHQIVLQYWGVTVAIYFGICQTATMRVGYEVGKLNKEGVKLATFVNMGINTVIMFIIGIYYILFPKSVIGIDLNIANPRFEHLVHFAVIFLAFSAVYQLFDSGRLVMIGALRGLKDTKIPMLISAVAFWLVALPLAYFFGFVLNLKGTGVWLGLPIGIAISAVILWIRFNRLVDKTELSSLLI